MAREYPGPDGKTCSRHWSVRALFDHESRPIGYQVVGRDITHLKNIEKELRAANEQPAAVSKELEECRRRLDESEAKYHELINLSPHRVFETDRDFRVTYANHHAVETFGITVREIEQGRVSFLTLIDPSQHGQLRAAATGEGEGAFSGPRECTALGKDGAPFTVVCYSSRSFLNGSYIGFREILVNVPPQKGTEGDWRKRTSCGNPPKIVPPFGRVPDGSHSR